MSIWDSLTPGELLKVNHWPNPAKAAMRYFHITACEDTLQMEAAWWGLGFLAWAFSSFVPSPRELERKFATGAYKCGFYGLQGPASPLSIIWYDETLAQVVLEIASPLTHALYVIWFNETIFSAISTYQSMMYQVARCDADRYECLLGFSSANLPPGIHSGNPVMAGLIWDPNGWADTADNAIDTFDNRNLHATAWGYLLANNHIVHSATVSFYIGTQVVASQELNPMEQFGLQAWRLEYAGLATAGTIHVQIDYNIEGGGLINSEIQCLRFTVRQVPNGIPNEGGPLKNAPPPDLNPPCTYLQSFYDSM